jgi:hypothetical protein
MGSRATLFRVVISTGVPTEHGAEKSLPRHVIVTERERGLHARLAGAWSK